MPHAAFDVRMKEKVHDELQSNDIEKQYEIKSLSDGR